MSDSSNSDSDCDILSAIEDSSDNESCDEWGPLGDDFEDFEKSKFYHSQFTLIINYLKLISTTNRYVGPRH